MVRKSLLVAALLTTAVPLSAQQVEWTSKRPDGQAPLGVVDGQLLNARQFRISYSFTQMDSKGVWYDNDSIPLATTLESYSIAPLTLSNRIHEVGIAYAPTSDLTLTARISYSQRQRQQFTSDSALYVISAKELGDLEISGLYDVYHQGAYRAHLHMGVLVPTGVYDTKGETPFSSPDKVALPYDMRGGSGTFAILPGLTVLAQNDVASVGAQSRGTFYFGKNGSEFSPGDRYDFNAWGAYKLNDYFSVSGRVHYQRWDDIKGADPSLDPFADPGNESYSSSGRRLDIPVGLNIYLPEGMRLGGNRISVEYIYPVSQHYGTPQLGADWGVSVGWQAIF